MPKNRVGFIIATYKGVKVDWPVTIADSLRAAIQSVVDGKKVWTVVAPWLTLLAPPVPAIKRRSMVERRMQRQTILLSGNNPSPSTLPDGQREDRAEGNKPEEADGEGGIGEAPKNKIVPARAGAAHLCSKD